MNYIPKISVDNYYNWFKWSQALYKWACSQKLPTDNKCGIYLIYNKANCLYYIGSTSNFLKRNDLHYEELCYGVHSNYRIQGDWNKYGKGLFHFVVIEIVKYEDLECREQFWMDSVNPPYNIRLKADRSDVSLKSVRERISLRRSQVKSLPF